MIVTICYFLKSTKTVFILVDCNTLLSKNYVPHSITVVCVIGWIWEKKICLHSLAFRAYEFSRIRIIPWIRIRPQYTLKHSSNFKSVENVQSSNVSNSNFVTSLHITLSNIPQAHIPLNYLITPRPFLWPLSNEPVKLINPINLLCVLLFRPFYFD